MEDGAVSKHFDTSLNNLPTRLSSFIMLSVILPRLRAQFEALLS